MHGDDGDQGTWTFHKTELDGLTSVGGVPPSPTPELLGPRKAGHAGVAPLAAKAAVAKRRLRNGLGFISQKQCPRTIVALSLRPGNVFQQCEAPEGAWRPHTGDSVKKPIAIRLRPARIRSWRNRGTNERAINGFGCRGWRGKRFEASSRVAHLARRALGRLDAGGEVRAGSSGGRCFRILDDNGFWAATVLSADLDLVGGREPCDLERAAVRLLRDRGGAGNDSFTG